MVSCTHPAWKGGICKEYKQFIVANWIQQESMIYGFKGNPEYWNSDGYSTYFKEECMIGIPKKGIIKVFGFPTKTYSNSTVDLYIYCMDSLCLKMPIYGGTALYFEFRKDKVSGVFKGPTRE